MSKSAQSTHEVLTGTDPFVQKTVRLQEKLAPFGLSEVTTLWIATSFYNMDEALVDEIFQYGQTFKGQPMGNIPKHSSQIRACFQNCTNFTDNGTDEQWLYCEGWAFGKTIPVLHAWVNPEPGIAWDPTWQTHFEEPVQNNEYWGFALKPGKLPHLLQRSGVYGVLESPITAREIWKDPAKWLVKPT